MYDVSTIHLHASVAIAHIPERTLCHVRCSIGLSEFGVAHDHLKSLRKGFEVILWNGIAGEVHLIFAVLEHTCAHESCLSSGHKPCSTPADLNFQKSSSG